MSELILFQTTSPYDNDINKNGKLTPSELDSNFVQLKGDDINNVECNNNELIITFNNGETMSVILPESNIVTETNGDKIIDFKNINNDIILTTDEKTYSIDISDLPVIQEISSISDLNNANYNANTGVLTLTKNNGEQIKATGFINYLNDGIVDNIEFDNKMLNIVMKNGSVKSVDLSSLISTINVDTYNFNNKVVRINQIKSNDEKPLKINEHLIIMKDITYEKKQMTVGENIVDGANSLAVGNNNTIHSGNSLSVGSNNTQNSGATNSTIIGESSLMDNKSKDSLSIGKEIEIYDSQSIGTGYKTKITQGAKYSLASGNQVEVGAPSAQAFGFETKVLDNADAAMAQGKGSIASGRYSHAEGLNTKAQGESSHSEGSSTKANWKDSHAEGYDTLAEGHAAHAEGYQTQSLETASHSEGQFNITKGLASHIQGNKNYLYDEAAYSFMGGSNNSANAAISFFFGENITTTDDCLKNVYVLGRNITPTVRDTLYTNKLNINNLEKVNNLKKFFLQQDTNGTVFKIDSLQVLEMLNGNFALITDGEFINYGDGSSENKIILNGNVEGYQVVIDNIENTHITNGIYDPYAKILQLTDNSGEIIDIDFSGGEIPVLLYAKVLTNNTLNGDGTETNPLRISPNEQTGQYKPVISIVNDLPSTDMLVGDRYIVNKEIITGGYLYDFDDIKEVDFGNGWRIPTKQDWNLMLNDLEPNSDDKNHDTPGVSGWRGAIAANALKSKSFGGNNIFDFSILPTKYINSDSSISSGNNAKFWSISRVLNEWDVFTKRFNLNEGRVFSEPVAPVDEKLSLRLVNDNIEGNTGTVTINGVTYNTVILPNQQLWLASNLMDNTIPYTLSEDSSTKTIITVAEWTGTEWIYQELKEGYSIVVINDINGECVEYRIINGILNVVQTGGSNTISWGDIDGILSDQTDLQTELDEKIDKSIFSDTHDALVADMIVAPEVGSLVEITKILKNVDDGQNFVANVHIKSEEESLISTFTQDDTSGHEYTITLDINPNIFDFGNTL